PEYVVIDPENRQLRLYSLKTAGIYGEPKLFNPADTVAFACLPTISFVVGELFAGSPDETL
ncbi:hypothetical protein, partial [Klebsiella pneumoniae]|uniref:hypothetical protein n=1 Tax=Klebsiella pneumoniae TaxID=573 RepID=UPI003F523038